MVVFWLTHTRQGQFHLRNEDFQNRPDAGRSQRIEATPDLHRWGIIAAAKDTPIWTFADPDGRADSSERYYRLVQAAPPVLAPHRSWKPAITLPADPFLSPPLSGTGSIFDATEVRWIKFALVVDDLPRVIFQDSKPYPFHYQFAVERLSPFLGLGVDEFNAISLFNE